MWNIPVIRKLRNNETNEKFFDGVEIGLTYMGPS